VSADLEASDGLAVMARAIQLAERGLYTADPNPRVGCVLVKEGRVIGEGWHRRAGEPHAERLAIDAAGELARGATAFVTLEPCCHYGRTPPCTDALLAAGVRRVVVGMEDPNPLVHGRGLERMRAAGVEVVTGVLEAACRALNPGFDKRMRLGLPWVRVKLAASLDGGTALANGESRWITSDAARTDVQWLRARSSAILTGIGTVLADDPSLNVRLPPTLIPALEAGEPVRQPLRVILDDRLRLPLGARMLPLPGATLVATLSQDPKRIAAVTSAGAEVWVGPPGRDGRLDLEALLRYLAEREINEVLIEAGPTLAGAMVQRALVDELALYLAPHLMGSDARRLFELGPLGSMGERVPLQLIDVRQVGPDLRLHAGFRRAG
jgi:diaminohydroxyphosphoribosylaminopyrimidine deaminase/5-amino-6-(5-phosphoribosylamino)uracil reductase